MKDNKGLPMGGPRSATERRRMEEFVTAMKAKLEDTGLSEQDIQAVLVGGQGRLAGDLRQQLHKAGDSQHHLCGHLPGRNAFDTGYATDHLKQFPGAHIGSGVGQAIGFTDATFLHSQDMPAGHVADIDRADAALPPVPGLALQYP